MDVYIARQPIFDRNLKVFGYELLYRQNKQNFFTGVNDDQATSELIYNTFVIMEPKEITGGALAFINFSKDLIDSDIPYLLPPKDIVVEVLERNEANQATVEACKKLRSKGYTIALDDFIFDKENSPLIEFADIIKVEYPAVDIATHQGLIKQYGSRIKFLAEKIETREDFNNAVKMGYDFFQGYFFSKPAMLDSKEIESFDVNILNVVRELSQKEPNFYVISDIIERDMGLSYKLLKLVNSVYYGAKSRIKDINQALVYIGSNELYQWFSLMMLKNVQNIENAEIIKLSLIRGKLMEFMAVELGCKDKMEYFFTGIFSFIDVLLNKPIEKIMDSLPLSDSVKQALLGNDNEHRKFLDCVIACESADWGAIEHRHPMDRIGVKKFMDLYIESLKWAERLNY